MTLSDTAPPMAAPVYLRHRPARPAEELAPHLAAYADRYARAGALTRRLYDDIVGRMRRSNDTARTREARRADIRQHGLDAGLFRLGRDLQDARGALGAARFQSLLALDGAVTRTRAEIARAAADAVAAFIARARRIDADLSDAAAEADRVRGLPAEKLEALGQAEDGAFQALDDLSANATTRLRAPQEERRHGPAMRGARDEILHLHVHQHVAEAKRTLAPQVDRMQAAVMEQSPPAERALCRAFCPFQDLKAMLADEAPEAARAAQGRSLGRLAAAARSAEDSLEHLFDEAERAAILQHDRLREQLIETAQGRADEESAQAEAQGRGQAAALGAVAGAQDAALTAVDRLIARQAGQPEEGFAESVIAYADGLAAGGLSVGRGQADAAEAAAGAARAAQDRAGADRDRALDDGVRRGGGMLADMAGNAAVSGQHSVREIAARMGRLVDPVRATTRSFLARADAGFDAAYAQLGVNVQAIATSILNAFAGTPAGADGAAPAAASGDAAADGGCAVNCGGETAPDASAGGAEGGTAAGSRGAPESADALESRLTSYADAPETEPNVAGFLRTAPGAIERNLVARAERLNDILCLSDAEPYSVLDQLRGLTRWQAAAVEEVYPGDLRDDIFVFVNVGNLFTGYTTRKEARRAAWAYLNGDVERGVVHELNVAVNLWNDSERIDIAMQALTPEQAESMGVRFGPALATIRSDLNALDTQVFDALRRGDAGEARALRLREEVNTARLQRGNRGADAAVDAITRAHEARGSSRMEGAALLDDVEAAGVREARLDHAWADMLAGFADIEGVTETEDSRGDALVGFAMREREYLVDQGAGGRHSRMEVRREGVSDDQGRLIRNLVRHGEGGPHARAARLAVELNRPGGPNPDRVRTALDDTGLNAALVGADSEALRRAQEDRALMLRLVDDYAPPEDGAAGRRSLDDIRRDLGDRLARGVRNDTRRANYLRALVQDDQTAPDTVIARLDYAMEGAGTHVDALKHALSGLTREQFDAVRARYDETHDVDLLTRIGIRGRGSFWHSETSGDTANELEWMSLGVARNERERAEVSALKMRQQIRDADGSLGPLLSGDEFGALERDYGRLMAVMGASDVGFDSDGNFVTSGADGQAVALGRFDDAGRFVPPPGFHADDLALAMTVGEISAENYRVATDRIADAIATTLVVAAAIVTTALTGGAAASIWIPVLVTAAAGVAAMGVKYAIKGGRYGSEEMLQDLALTVVQAATAGAGAAAGAALRGGGKAAGALARNWRLSEQALATAAGGGARATQALPGLGFAQEMFVGALGGAFSGGASAALNFDSYRKDDYAQEVLHGIIRGSFSGAATAGVTRSVGGGATSLARRGGARAGARDALSGGAGLDAAGRAAAFRSRLYGTSALTEVGGRALGSGLGGMAGRGLEIFYDDAALSRGMSVSRIMGELGAAFAQNAAQGAGEAGIDRAVRARSASRLREHAFTTHADRADYLQRGRDAAMAQARRLGVAPPASPAAEAPVVVRPVVESGEAADAAARPTVAAGEDGAVLPVARTGEADPAVVIRPVVIVGDEGVAARPAALAATGDGVAVAPRPPAPANDNTPMHRRVALADVDMGAAPMVREGAVIIHPDSASLMAANDNFGRLVNADPTREVAIHHNPVSGEYVVIQGDSTSVAIIRPGGELAGPGAGGRLVSRDGQPSPGGHWIVHSHFHPNRPGQASTAFIRRLPSGFAGDFGVLNFESVGLGLGARRSRIYYSDDGRVAFTDFGVAPGHPEGRYWIDYPDPATGARIRRHFAGARDYERFVHGVAADPSLAAAPAPAAGAGGEGAANSADAAPSPGPLRALPVSDPARAAAPDIADPATIRALAEAIETVGEHRRALSLLAERGASASTLEAARGWLGGFEADAQSMVHALGMVGQPDSMARLRVVMNDTTLDASMRQAIANVALEATRAHMLAAGRLDPDEPLMLLFHGAPVGRADSLARDGVDFSRIGSGRDDDFGRGFYLTGEVGTAENYATKFGADRGAIFPFMMRRRDLGVVVDVRPDGAHRAVWEAFVRANIDSFDEPLRMLGPEAMQALMEGRSLDFAHMDATGNRGGVFDAFLRHLGAADPALASPDVVLGELGGPFTTGVGHGDQQAVRTARIADALNRQIAPDDIPMPADGPILRTADSDPGPGPAPRAGAEDAGAASAPRGMDDAMEAALLRAITRSADDVPEMIDARVRLEGIDESLLLRALVSDLADRPAVLRDLYRDIRARQGDERRALRMLNVASTFVERVAARFAIEREHGARVAAHGARIEALPPPVRALVTESPLALHLFLNPQLQKSKGVSLFDFYLRKAAMRTPPAMDAESFDKYVRASLSRYKRRTMKDHAANLDRYTARNPSQNEAMDIGIPAARAAAGYWLDIDPVIRPTPPAPETDAAPRSSIGAATDATPGTRVETSDGAGTLIEIAGGVARVSLDSAANPNAFAEFSLGRDPVFVARAQEGVDPTPLRSAEEQASAQRQIDDHRADGGVPAFDPLTRSGTVAIARVGDREFFGANSTLAPALSTLSRPERAAILAVMKQFGIDAGKPGARAEFVDHAEMAALVRARIQMRGAAMPDVVELFVDRSACANCRANLHALASWLGVKEIRIYYRNQKTPPPPLIIKARQ